MNKYFSALVMILSLLLNSVLFNSASAQFKDDLFYVVIGAFANPRNANEFTENAKNNGLDAHNEFNSTRKLFYVFILETPDKPEAVSLALKHQHESVYPDTWVYTRMLSSTPQVVHIDKADMTGGSSNNASDTLRNEISQPTLLADGSKEFIFKLRSIDTGENIAGDVDVFDADIIKGRKVISYRGNDVVTVKPINKSGNIVVVCDVFGYRKVQLPLNFNDPKIEDGVSLEDGKVVVNLDLVRLKKGDKVVMYNVYFFNHAAIMRPESRFEVNALLDYLKEKSTSKIRIHGHANGNDFGKIITLGKSNDYYGLSRDNNETKGSVTKLSEERARIIQSYLVNEGIDIQRMEIKAWGGKMPIYDEDHSLAQANVRVEIEIIEE